MTTVNTTHPSPPQQGAELVVEIETLTSSAEGLARHQGQAVFIPGLLPGESARVSIQKSARDYLRANPLQILKGSATRKRPECPYHHAPDADGQFPNTLSCGGCQLQISNREQELDFKRQSVGEILSRIGHLEVEVQPVVAGHPFHYRNKMALSLTSHDGQLAWGLRCSESNSATVPLATCEIAGLDLWKAAGQILQVLNQDMGPSLMWNGQEGIIRGATIRSHTGRISPPRTSQDRAETQPARVVLFAVATHNSDILIRLRDALKVIPDLHVHFSYSDPRANAVYYDRAQFLHVRTNKTTCWTEANFKEENCCWHTTGPWSTLAGPTTFLQVNDEMAAQLYSRVLNLPFEGSGFAVDAYCGVGILTRALLGRFDEVMGIELDTQSIKLARTTSRRLQDCRVEWVAEASEAVFGRVGKGPERTIHSKPDLVILDPPRKGCQQEVLRALLELKPSDVVYISCHPAALARDLRLLCRQVYEVVSVEPFDLFPNTHHVETLVHLKRK